VRPRSVIARTVDRALHTTAVREPHVGEGAARLHATIPVVDLVVGTPIFRDGFLIRRRRGHVDLPRVARGGLDLIGFTVATRHPDLRGTLSTPHFWSRGVPVRALRSDRAIAEALLRLVDRWVERSDGRLRRVLEADDLDAIGPGTGVVGVLTGVQGGHVLGGDPVAVGWLAERGVRMLALAHVMDNDLVGSGTGRRAEGISGLGREVVAELQRAGIVVDLAHMSTRGIEDSLPLLHRPFVLSHTGFTRLAGSGSRIPGRRFTPANRNIPDRAARMVAEAGGAVGITLSTRLLGGDDLDAVARAVDAGLELCGPGGIALGSDMDGALGMVVDAAGLPGVTERLLAAGHDGATVAAFMGGNALRVLRASLPGAPAIVPRWP
jgi:membrane dipeptidase